MEKRKKNEIFNLNYWINPDRGELFFARKIVLVEGQTEKTVIPYLAKKIGVFRYDYTLIDCGNKGNIITYLTLLNKFGLKYVVVYDLDHQTRKTKSDMLNSDQLSEKIDNAIDPEIGFSMVFVNDIEEEIGIINKKSKAFIALQTVSENNYKIPQQLSNKIKKIYQ